MHRFDVDSLLAVEIRYWLTKETKTDMSYTKSWEIEVWQDLVY